MCSIYFYYVPYPPPGKGSDLLFEQTQIPFPPEAYNQSWLKLTQLFCRGKFLNDVNLISDVYDISVKENI